MAVSSPSPSPSLADLRPDDVVGEYHRRGLERWSDEALVAAVGEVLAVPRAAPADSFVLHAPLELLARAALLERLHPPAREAARQRLVWLAASYAAAGDPVEPPAPVAGERNAGELGAGLVDALAAGDLDDVDRYALALGRRAGPMELRRLLAGAVAASLAAAAHASILLYLHPRVALAREVTGSILRGPARELAREAGWRLRWFEDPDLPPAPGPLLDALLDVPPLGVPGSAFIYPVMHQAEESGLAVKLLAGLGDDRDVTGARRDLGRVAAWSMLQEPATHAPYGWSHCLTMPQAVLGCAAENPDPAAAVAIAATHVVGFRAALGERRLRSDVRPDPVSVGPVEALDGGRDLAAAAAWHAPEPVLDELEQELATRASRHHDAHLVKYTQASFDAAAADPASRRLHLAAAASLCAYWAEQPDDGF